MKFFVFVILCILLFMGSQMVINEELKAAGLYLILLPFLVLLHRILECIDKNEK